MSGLPWFRMYTDFLNDPKMISIAFEDQRHFIGLLALKSDGVLDQDCESELLDRIVSQRLWLDFLTVGDVKKRMISAGLIDSKWQPLAWDKRQKTSDHDATGAERQRRFREKKKAEKDANALCNATVTPPDKIREEDIRQDKGAKARFVVPTETQVIEYAESKGWQIDAEKFCGFYESNGWVVGKNKMKSWKGAISNSRDWAEIKNAPKSALDMDEELFGKGAI